MTCPTFRTFTVSIYRVMALLPYSGLYWTLLFSEIGVLGVIAYI